MQASGSIFVISLMAVLAILVVVALLLMIWAATGSLRVCAIAGTVIGALMLLQNMLASSGLLRTWSRVPPPMGAFLLLMLTATVAFAFSVLGTTLASRTSFLILVASQIFRFPLELTMHQAAFEGVMPLQMSYSGLNFDILTGLSAILISALLATRRAGLAAVRIWNIAGSLLLLNIVVIAVASMPVFRAFGEDRMNVWVTYPVIVWLPGILVPFALLGHLLIWRKLGMSSEKGRQS